MASFKFRQTGHDQQDGQDIAAGRQVPLAAEPDHDFEQHRQAHEADQPGAAGDQVTAAAHHPAVAAIHLSIMAPFT